MIIGFDNMLNEHYNRHLFNGICVFTTRVAGLRVRAVGEPKLSEGARPTTDGIISQSTENLIKARDAGLPCVNVSSKRVHGIPQVCADNIAICRMVVEHFRERNFRTLSILCDESSAVSAPRKQAFGAVCEELGFLPHFVEQPTGQPSGDLYRSALSQLEALPKPAGMMLVRDAQFPFIQGLCNDLGIQIPDHLALVGVDNSSDTFTNERPALSSVDLNAERIGFEAAALLVDLINGKPVPELTLVQPKELISRAYSDVTIHLDPDLAKALDYMRLHLQESIVLEDVLRQQGLARRALENRFKARFGEPPMRHLRSMRLEKAKLWLETTELTVTEIAKRCGIPDNNYLTRLFRERYGMTPLAYRRQHAAS